MNELEKLAKTLGFELTPTEIPYDGTFDAGKDLTPDIKAVEDFLNEQLLRSDTIYAVFERRTLANIDDWEDET